MPAAEVGDVVTVEIFGDFSELTNSVLGGGVDILFDDSVLTHIGYVWGSEGDPAFARDPDIQANQLNGIAVGDFGCLPATFLIGTVSFVASVATDDEFGSGGPSNISTAQNNLPAGFWINCATLIDIAAAQFNQTPISIFEPVDTDGDGLRTAAEFNIGSDPLDPDTDDDGRIDGSDGDPLIPTPNFCIGDNALIGPYTVVNAEVIDCRAQLSVTSNSDMVIEAGGEALFMSQEIGLNSGFRINLGGIFTAVIATDIAN